MAVPGVTADQLGRDERRKQTMTNNFIYTADSDDENAGESQAGQDRDKKSKLKGLARLLHLELVCQLMSQFQTRVYANGKPSSFPQLRNFLKTNVSMKNEIDVFADYGIGAQPDVDGGKEGELSWRNETNSSHSLYPGAGLLEWCDANDDDFADVHPDTADIRRHVLVGSMSTPMTESIRTAAWTTIEEAPYPAALLRYPKRLVFDVGPRMREYLNKRDGAAQEEAWYHPGMRDRIQVRDSY